MSPVNPYVGTGIGAGATIAGAAGVPGAGLVPGLYGLGTGAASGNAGSIIGSAKDLGLTALNLADILPSFGAGIPIAAWATILSSILTDELNDPGGRVSAAQDQASGYGRTVPGLVGTLAGAHQGFGGVNDHLTDDQALGLFRLLRGGVKANELMADPSAMQGKNESGVQMPNYGGNVANLRTVAGPESVLGTLRLQDLMAQRGLRTPEFETATPLQREMAGLNWQAANGGGVQNQFTGMPSPFDASGNLAGLGELHPHEALAKAGFNQANLLSPENAPQMMAAYGVTADNPMPDALKKAFDWLGQGRQEDRALYTPDVMEKLYKIQPGGYEAGIKDILSGAPTGEGKTFLGLAGDMPPTFAARAPVAPAPPEAPALPPTPSLLDPMTQYIGQY